MSRLSFPSLGGDVDSFIGGGRGEAQNSYRGAARTRTGTGWERIFPYNNGSLQSRMDLIAMRDRAFTVYENNPVAKSALDTEVTNVVCDGYRHQARGRNADGTPAKDWNAEAEDRWPEFLDQADIRGVLNGSQLQRNPYRSARRDGGGGFVLVDQGGFSKLQHVPGAKIVTPDDKLGDLNFANGIELDASLAPAAFHILDMDGYGKRTFTRIPANNFIYLLPDLDDDLGVIAPSCFATIFQQLDQLMGYIDGVAVAARMATIFGLMVKSDSGPADFANLKRVSNADGTFSRALTLDEGSIKILGSKDDVVQVNAQQPMTQTPAFVNTLLRIIGAPFSMPLEIVAHNMSEANFATARMGVLGYYRSCYARMKWYKTSWSRIRNWWASRERKRQHLGLPGAFVTPFPAEYFPHTLHSRAWAYTDPIRDPQSDFMQLDMGTKSLPQICAERSTDHDEVQIQQAASMAMRRALGLPTDIRSTLSRDVITIRGNDPATVAGEDAGTQEQQDKSDGFDYSDDEKESGDSSDE